MILNIILAYGQKKINLGTPPRFHPLKGDISGDVPAQTN